MHQDLLLLQQSQTNNEKHMHKNLDGSSRRNFTCNKSMKTRTKSIGKWNNIMMAWLFNRKVGNIVARWWTRTYRSKYGRGVKKNYLVEICNVIP